MADESNVSANTITTRVRNRFEYRHILNHYLQIKDPNDFLRIFPEAIKYGQIKSDTIPFALGQMGVENSVDFVMLWGLDLLYDTLQNKETAKILEREFNFTYQDFIELSGKCDPFILSDFFSRRPLAQLVQKNTFRTLLSVSKEYARAIKFIITRLLLATKK